MAQLVEQLIRNQQVASSSLAISSKTKPLTFVRGFVFRLTSFFNSWPAVPRHVILRFAPWRSRTTFARLSSRSRKRFVSPLLVVLQLLTCRSSSRNTRLRLVAFGGEPPRASIWGMRVRLFSFPFREIATSLSFLAMTTRHKRSVVSHRGQVFGVCAYNCFRFPSGRLPRRYRSSQ